MVPGRHLPLHGTKPEVTITEGSVCLKPPGGPLPDAVPICEGNTIALDLISTQPVPAPDPACAQADEPQKPELEPSTKPQCPRCGLPVPASRDLRGPQGSSISVHSGNSRKSKTKKDTVAPLNQPAAAATPGDWCFDLLLSCLFCHCSAVLLGLLDLCSFGLSSLCSCCAEGCECCCSSAQGVPMEELSCHTHCHSVLVQSCCEPMEFLEFCLECCQICHRT